MARSKINAGYKIIESVKPTDETEFVLGQNIHNPNLYVTWRCINNGKDYYAGQYCEGLLQARKNLYERALTSLNHALPTIDKNIDADSIMRDVNGEKLVFKLTPEEMEHIWDIVSQENIVNDIKYRLREKYNLTDDELKEKVLSDNAQLIEEIGQKFRSDGSMVGDSFWTTLDTYLDERISDFKLPEQIVYMESFDYANQHGAIAQFQESHKKNMDCLWEIKATAEIYASGGRIDTFIQDLTEKYGIERPLYILSRTVQAVNDDRFTQNKRNCSAVQLSRYW